MTERLNEWMEVVEDYLEIDHVMNIFPAPVGMKFNNKLAPDSYSWADSLFKTVEQKREFFLHPEYKGGNIGCACLNLVVVDLDKKNGVDGLKTWAKWLEENPGTEPSWVSMTPSGGAHVFFRLTTDQKERYQGHKKLRAVVGLETKDSGVDIRTGRSHVMLPESTFEGGCYKWSGKYHPTKLKMAEAPEWLLEKIVGGGALDKEFKQVSLKHRTQMDGTLPHIKPKDMPEAVAKDKGGSGRDVMIHKAGSRWVTECEARIHMGEMTREEGADFVWANMNEYNKIGTGGKPKDGKAVQRIYQSVMKYARRQWEAQTDEAKETVVQVLETFPGAKVTEVRTV